MLHWWETGTHRGAGGTSLLDYGRRRCHFEASFNPWIPQCGLATAAEGPSHRPGAVDLGKELTDNFISNFTILWSHHGTYTMTGNGVANLACELLEQYPRVRQIASGTSNPWQSSRFAGNAAAITASLRRPLEKGKSRSCSMEECHSSDLLTSLQRSHLR